ncbi:hypothetical protein GCM10010912_58250 [Paenibacillus albidus]|uniref:Uncharacterized protein n=1 Tax=Paenibacillus albidus TaxID=2041023 RepID=A0A917FT28_9BACL|nr:hypothetical protein [Paenibacillus albidus]GGG05950.1 hypothetical protein GCM10010912_58250 [Paenibacillus albidus]
MSNVDTQYEIKFLLDANQVLTDEHTLRTELVHLDLGRATDGYLLHGYARTGFLPR